MNYYLSFSNPLCHLVDIHAVFRQEEQASTMTLQLPAWRPGRYQLMHFARFIQKLRFEGADGRPLEYQKTGMETWKVKTRGTQEVHVYYNYFANQMDGGGSWLDETQVYINPINCLFYDVDAIDQPCEIELDLPEHCIIASALNFEDQVASTDSYFELVDKPIIASMTLRQFGFSCKKTPFKVWIQGEGDFDWDKTNKDLMTVADYFHRMFGGFPFDDYHFLVHFLPYQHYHGVEHKNSTVITLGPTEDIDKGALYGKFLGVCSHELFHAWNVCLIRPKELLPYDFARPVLFETGYVAEGFTTYYGDIALVRSGVIEVGEYFRKLNQLIARHFDNGGRFNSSLASSSINLWLNGYEEGAPNSKVSIYVKGAIVALMLDLDMLIQSKGEKSLNDLVRYLWAHYGTTGVGYQSRDLLSGLKEITGRSYKKFFDQFIYGCEPVEAKLGQLLEKVGCTLEKTLPSNGLEKKFGFRYREENDRVFINQIVPLSPAYGNLCIHDEVSKIDGKSVKSTGVGEQVPDQIELSVIRGGKEIDVNLVGGQVLFFSNYQVHQQARPTAQGAELFRRWLSVV